MVKYDDPRMTLALVHIPFKNTTKPKSKRQNTTCSSSFVEPRPKMMIMMVIVMEHECIWGTIWEDDQWERRMGKRKGSEG
jgi:hypothetical protein